MSQHEIATQVNVTTDAVKSWGKEARRKLRQQQTKLNACYNNHNEKSMS